MTRATTAPRLLINPEEEEDCLSCLTGKDDHALQNSISMQLYLTRVVDWLGIWGLNVNPSTSSVQWFSRKRGVDISIKINDIISCVQGPDFRNFVQIA